MRPVTKRFIGHVIDTGLTLLAIGILTGIGWYLDFRGAPLRPPNRT